MPVPSSVRERIRGFLPAGSQIRYIFPASWNETAFFFVVVTETSITVITAGMMSRTRLKSIWHVFPRDVRLGPVDTSLIPVFELGGRQFEVDDEYVPVINAADAELLGQDAMPPDPLADL